MIQANELNRMKKLFRFHAGSLDDSMKTVVEFTNKENLINIIKHRFPKVNDIEIEFYIYDDRIDWDNYIITHQGSVIGFTNSLL